VVPALRAAVYAGDKDLPLAGVALGTGSITALRAARTDPSLVLRHD
jgi:hypothetical protein